MIGTWFHKVLNILCESAVFLVPKVSRNGITHYLSIYQSAVSMVVSISSAPRFSHAISLRFARRSTEPLLVDF